MSFIIGIRGWDASFQMYAEGATPQVLEPADRLICEF
jgi:hypothetical protein